MDSIPDKTIDCVICDPPYGTTPITWDRVIPFEKLWKQYDRIVKPNCAVLIFAQEPFASFLRVSNIKDYRYDWYWEKERLTNVFQVKKRCGKTVENIVVFYKKQCTYNPQKRVHTGKLVTNKIGDNAKWSVTQAGYDQTTKPFEYKDDGTRYPTQVLRFNRDDTRKRIHPTQKPVELLEYLIRTYTDEGETILDMRLARHGNVEDYIEEINNTQNCVVYIDPPYKSTAGFNNIDIEKIVNSLNKTVFVSEGYELPNADECIVFGERKKGNINGSKKKQDVSEVLSIFIRL